MRHVVVAPDPLLHARLPHTLDHRIVVERIGDDQAVGNQLGERGDAGLVRHIAGREHQRGFLAVQVGELMLELDQRVIGAGDVAGTAGAGADAGRGLDHRADHLRVLAHAEIIVRAPDHDVTAPLGGMPERVRETAGDALEVDENPIAPLLAQLLQRGREICLVVHPSRLSPATRLVAFRNVPRCLSRPYLPRIPASLICVKEKPRANYGLESGKFRHRRGQRWGGRENCLEFQQCAIKRCLIFIGP